MKSIAILLASYNGERFIRQQIDSLFSQSVQDFVLYVHDDGSTDHTVIILNEYKQKYGSRIHILEGPPTGSSRENFRFLMAHAEADYYFLCDQDDVWKTDKIQRSVTELQRLEQGDKDVPCMVFGDMCVVDENLQEINTSYMYMTGKNPEKRDIRSVLKENVAAGCTMCMNRVLVKKALQIESFEKLFMHDWWLLLVGAAYGRTSYIREPLVLYRQHQRNTVGAKRTRGAVIKRLIRNMTDGTWLVVFREEVQVPRQAAGALLKLELGTECLKEADRAFLLELSCISGKPKWKRVWFYLRNPLLQRKWKILLV